MTLPVRSDTDPGSAHGDAEFASAHDAAEYIVTTCLADGPIGRVGLEVEAHCVDLADPMRRPGWDEITGVIAAAPPLPGGSAITVEPGGAVELSGPPFDGVVPAITALAADRAALRTVFEQAGLGLVLLGCDPLRPAERVNPGARYLAMEQFFRASGTGEAGAAMMTSTASVQVNLDAGPQDGWADRVALAHALGPVMVAIAANSPMLGGRFTGWCSTRQQVWGRLDASRSGPVLGASGIDPANDWATYALRAPVMLVPGSRGGPDAMPVRDWVPFADWADGGVVLGDRRPTRSDLEYHLTTLFPPVRPRRWLEIRYLDSVPDDVWPAVVFTLTTLLDDPQAAEEAREATADVAAAWDRAARIGFGDRHLHEAAVTCVRAAADRAPADLAESMARLQRFVEAGRAPADDFTDLAVDVGVEDAVRRIARGER